jgi:hypothetical protein
MKKKSRNEERKAKSVRNIEQRSNRIRNRERKNLEKKIEMNIEQ